MVSHRRRQNRGIPWTDRIYNFLSQAGTPQKLQRHGCYYALYSPPLAAQQFTRAATLICACEYIRQDCAQKRHKYPSYPLGKEPITIGLWIGGSHIPNKNVGTGERSNSAEYHLGKLQSVSSPYYVRNEKERHNKFQVLKCPCVEQRWLRMIKRPSGWRMGI